MTDDPQRSPQRRRTPRIGRTGARFPRVVEKELADDEDPGEQVDETSDQPLDEPALGTVGRTGARFGSRGRRTRREAEQAAAADAAIAAILAGQPDATPTAPIEVAVFEVSDTDHDDRVWVRPYVRTRGRTRARVDLAVETLVSLPSPHPLLTDHEHRAIAAICARPVSVAEVAARHGVPLGVARVLIDDMASAGLLRVHARSVAGSGPPALSMMQRVLDGLHKL